MEMVTLIMETEPLAGRLLEALLYKWEGLSMAGLVSSWEEVHAKVRTTKIDVLFVAAPGLEETDREQLFTLTKDLLVVLHSPDRELAAEVCLHGGAGFLPDPIPYEAIPAMMAHWKGLLAFRDWKNRVQASAPAGTSDYFFVKSDYKIVKVEVNEILFIEGLGEYIRIYTENDKIVTLQSLARLESMLPASHFFRIHRSYIINLDKIKFIQNHVVAIGNHQLPVSKSQRKAFLEFIEGKGIL